jgi:hypothetical protein
LGVSTAGSASSEPDFSLLGSKAYANSLVSALKMFLMIGWNDVFRLASFLASFRSHHFQTFLVFSSSSSFLSPISLKTAKKLIANDAAPASKSGANMPGNTQAQTIETIGLVI